MDYKIDIQFDQVRLDRWVRTIFPGAPQSLVEKALRKKDILVNGQKSSSSYRLNKGDDVTFKKTIETFSTTNNVPAKYNQADFEELMSNLIFENDEYIVLNKPAGYAVQGGGMVKKSVIDLLNSHDTAQDFKIVHRIDKDTTGILIVAKTLVATRYFAQLFRSNDINKTYLAIVQGVIAKPRGEMRNKLLKVHDRVVEDDRGKESVAEYEVLRKWGDSTLVKVKPITGRMHQIRVQLAQMGYPILGDKKYNPEARGSEVLMLHAAEIQFIDSRGVLSKYEAPLPDSFAKFMKG